MSELVRAALAKIVDGGELALDEARLAMGSVMDGEATPAQLGALLAALRMRGETVDELAGFAAAMRERVLRVEAPAGAIDVVGTGGDRSGTINLSTAAGLVVAAAGVPVAKHGNRAITSKAGSADTLDALGVRIDHDPASAAASLTGIGFAFLFAPSFHPAMRHAGPTRREIGIRTAFNVLGPLTNPAGVRRLMVGAADADLAPRMAEVLRRLGDERAFVVHGVGVDELPLDGTGVLYEVTPDGVERREVVAAEYGLEEASTAELAGGTAEENAAVLEAVLAGRDRGHRRSAVVLNAGVALHLAGRPTIGEGIETAAAAIDGGAASALLDRLRAERRAAEAGS
jgi:anthranilate phosphoribosyltransferase